MGTLQAIVAVIVALPKIFSFIKEAGQALEKMFGPNWPEMLVNLEQTTKRLNAAKTLEDRVDCARDLQKILNKL